MQGDIVHGWTVVAATIRVVLCNAHINDILGIGLHGDGVMGLCGVVTHPGRMGCCRPKNKREI